MAKTEWQQRLRRLGMSQKEFGRLLGLDPNSISRQLLGRFRGGVPQHVVAVIVALEVMTSDQRGEWIRRLSIFATSRPPGAGAG